MARSSSAKNGKNSKNTYRASGSKSSKSSSSGARHNSSSSGSKKRMSRLEQRRAQQQNLIRSVVLAGFGILAIALVLVLFAARTDLRRRDPAVLRLYDEAAPLPPLLLPPVLEGQMPPGLCRPQLLAVLVESGVLRPGQITVGTAES